MNEVGFEIIETEEAEESGIKYLNINVSNSEVERNPDIVRLCADVGILEYIKSSGDLISRQAVLEKQYRIDDSTTLSTRDVVNVEDIEDLSSVNPQEPKIGHCKDCR